MELAEAAVSVLVDYLYTGEIRVDSDISAMMDIAVAAHCFQLQAGGNMLLTPDKYFVQEIVDWVYGIIIGNVSDTVMVDRGYDGMDKMSLITHLQSLGVTEWHQTR